MHTTNDDWLAHQGRWVNVTFLLRKGDAEYLVTLRDGRVQRIAPGPHVMPCWAFALVASDDAWERFWAAEPQPRFHDLMAMVRFKALRIETHAAPRSFRPAPSRRRRSGRRSNGSTSQ